MKYQVFWDGTISINEEIGRISATGEVNGAPCACIFLLGNEGLSVDDFVALSQKKKEALICKKLAEAYTQKPKREILKPLKEVEI